MRHKVFYSYLAVLILAFGWICRDHERLNFHIFYAREIADKNFISKKASNERLIKFIKKLFWIFLTLLMIFIIKNEIEKIKPS